MGRIYLNHICQNPKIAKLGNSGSGREGNKYDGMRQIGGYDVLEELMVEHFLAVLLVYVFERTTKSWPPSEVIYAQVKVRNFIDCEIFAMWIANAPRNVPSSTISCGLTSLRRSSNTLSGDPQPLIRCFRRKGATWGGGKPSKGETP
ncbi:hypothetical protein O6H91_22G034600 [Diphasiastrum complanatum]|uniref:Uncharacterized protein n=1 Tax=Diphasiastrum complanatum TaxID=34168 RepID=A0ACC2AEM3_DIPCM|nr:hypothetical protein O6H91_22G034600 [Diphasiastrum complanatum]